MKRNILQLHFSCFFVKLTALTVKIPKYVHYVLIGIYSRLYQVLHLLLNGTLKSIRYIHITTIILYIVAVLLII